MWALASSSRLLYSRIAKYAVGYLNGIFVIDRTVCYVELQCVGEYEQRAPPLVGSYICYERNDIIDIGNSIRICIRGGHEADTKPYSEC